MSAEGRGLPRWAGRIARHFASGGFAQQLGFRADADRLEDGLVLWQSTHPGRTRIDQSFHRSPAYLWHAIGSE